MKVEDSGYVTVIDMEKAEEVHKEKPLIKLPVVEESKTDPETTKFKEFFEEFVPFQGQAKHTYSV